MRRPPSGLAVVAVVSLSILAAAQAMAQQTETETLMQLNPPKHPVFGHTLMSGSGFIMTPHAFVPGQTTIYASGVAIIVDDEEGETMTEARGSVGVGLGRFLEAGVTSLRDLERYAAFGKLQILRQSGIFPAFAVGASSLTTVEGVGRYGFFDPTRTDKLEDVASFYGVFTYIAGPGTTGIPSWVMISGGWGSGLFLRNLPPLDDNGRSGGVFGSFALDFQAAEGAYIRVVVEHDGFDTNIGAVAYLEGLEVMAGVLSADEGGKPTPLAPDEPFDATRTGVGFLYNQAKPFVAVTLDARALAHFPWIWQ